MWAKAALAGFLGGLLISCAADSPEVVDAELSHLSNAAAAGVSTIERALRDGRMMTPATGDGSPGLIGEGLRAVDAATRALSRLEDDPRASEAQRLDAVVRQARAWDDAARVIAFAWHGVDDLDEAQRSLTAALLEEKAFPARVAARNSYERALRTACSASLQGHPAWPEIVDGVLRHGDAFTGDPCGIR